MKRLLLVTAAVTFMLAVPQYTLYGQMKEYPCCIPSKQDPTATDSCKMLPKWECKRRGGTVVEECSECPR
jgi:hypothetical protein